MDSQLTPERRADLRDALQSAYQIEFDEPLSEFRADRLIELFMDRLAPAIYNQAVADVRAHLQGKLDDLDGDVHMPER